MAKRSLRRNPTETELARDVASSGFYLPDFLSKVADSLEDEAEKIEEDDEEMADAFAADALLLRAIVRKHRKEFSE